MVQFNIRATCQEAEWEKNGPIQRLTKNPLYLSGIGLWRDKECEWPVLPRKGEVINLDIEIPETMFEVTAIEHYLFGDVTRIIVHVEIDFDTLEYLSHHDDWVHSLTF